MQHVALRYVVFVTAVMLAGCGEGATTQSIPEANTLAVRQSVLSSRISNTACPCYSVLHDFGSTPGDAALPGDTTLLYANGIFYGASGKGGTSGQGTVFSITPSGDDYVVYNFPYAQPDGRLTSYHGLFYGETPGGGDYGGGQIFSITRAGQEKKLYSFNPSTGDGKLPTGGLTVLNGTLYGVTQDGGSDQAGTIFSVTPDGKETVIHSFTGADGANPIGGLIALNGVLYGDTNVGGSGPPEGAYGTVYSVTPSGTLNVLHSFLGADGANPTASLVVVDGVLYGVAGGGGTYDGGTAFSLTTSGTFKTIYSFGNGTDGQGPTGLTAANDGSLYGTTTSGGTSTGLPLHGTLFKLTTSGTESILHDFGFGTDGGDPTGNSVTIVNGTIYGVTYLGGTANVGEGGDGVFYSLKP